MRKNSAAYIEMLFENRNKAYGAYDLRVNYENRLMKSFGMALLIAGFFFLIPYVLTKILTQAHENDKKVIPPLVYTMGEKFIIEKDKPSHPPVLKTKVIAKGSYKIVKNDEIRKSDEKIKPDDPVTPVPSAMPGISTDTASSEDLVAGNTAPDLPKIYSTASVDVIPAFPGGEDAMLTFLKRHLRYPKDAHENNITGRVYVSFVIDENGKVSEIQIMRGLGYGTEDEVTRVVSKMPDWTP
jgi:protein TonB